jgi:hypothetical protein
MNDLKTLNRLIQVLDQHVKENDSRGMQELTLADARQLRVYLYDLKLRLIKERDKINAK